MKNYFKWLYASIAVLAILLFFCLNNLADRQLHIYILDVGQGDAILIQTPFSERILIDGGPDSKVAEQLSQVMPFYEKEIDVVILTHPDADHVNGLVDVLKRYHVKAVMMTGLIQHSSGYNAFLEQITINRVPVFFVGNKTDFRLGSVVLDVLFPLYSLQGMTFVKSNNSSIALRLVYGKSVFYFSGDMEMGKELELVKGKLDLRADFLKVSHHGSNTSSINALIDKINPQFAAISCGVNNKFHHPHPVTIENFQKRGIKIYRTDLDGIIEATSNGKEIKVNIMGKPRI